LKATPAAVAPVEFASRGFALASKPIAFPQGTWWARLAITGGFGYFIASNESAQAWREFVRRTFAANAEWAEYAEEHRSTYRVAAIVAGKLDGVLFIGPAEIAPSWDAVRALFEGGKIEDHQRGLLLSGKSGEGLVAAGPMVCACFGVGLAAIKGAITSGAANIEEIGKALRAGTNCGSCLPELKRIIALERTAEAL
jgi:assimilatory nitrate reductase catalytic subunit